MKNKEFNQIISEDIKEILDLILRINREEQPSFFIERFKVSLEDEKVESIKTYLKQLLGFTITYEGKIINFHFYKV